MVELAEKALSRVFDSTVAKPHGFVTADFKEVADRTPYSAEINVRHVAFTPCSAAGGAYFPADTIQLLHGPGTFEHSYLMYQFPTETISLRDVDERPVLTKDSDLLKKIVGLAFYRV
ncbi:hypothetical protein A3SI_19406 [Nitritalea halalkaliphila LW7]|uniref:Uncharacterized protein n=1 Tax=Nitritalea halalkaliphila LW7 TaxID=1189621 RepID=I5BT70_9BACT|nr:hypothetical protein A3SI_19406 [Nitritalea halalkaliphila LW7]